MAITAQKQAMVADLKDIFVNAKGVVFTAYTGITVAQDTKLRRKFREAGVEYRVIKNTMAMIAAKETEKEGLLPTFEGATAMAFSKEDAVAPAKVLADFAKEEKLEALQVKAGLVEGAVIDAAGVKALADLPPREVLVAQVLAGMQSPIVGFVNVLQGTIRNLVYALEAVRKQKEA
ncbi:MAG: 50S ribosomal protein L10 [Selenomonadales bacterium]|nr:50S ribosomal protein L10 [Selenomonadales bacterium]MBQ2246932.1 50S ribosomal protein L10 [Selenomonadales bacterium]MBQ5587616.1 50S ribosomal protein L10 [Selenomonadales bacterium]MBQ5745478.1 50S ribosomal protein L10 [Selenomonadales bacterium]MBQ5832212.1 50S ribosomal protein L10 [Selenomonadales bacterium]